MTKVIVFATALLFFGFGWAQVSENRTVKAFSKLKAAQGVEVTYTVGNNQSILVETDDKDRLQMIKTEVEGETLKIFVETENTKKWKKEKGSHKTIDGVHFKTIKVVVTGKSLSSIKASSSASITIQNVNTSSKMEIASSSSGSIAGSFECTDCTADVSSSGSIQGKLLAKTAYLQASSSGTLFFTGSADSVEVKSSSSGSCDLKGFTAATAVVTASSASEVALTVTKSLNAAASSSAEIVYYGNPAQVNSEKSSSGSVTKR